jgi:hypothetical protein
MTTAIFDIDSSARVAQDAAVEEFYLDGVDDGFEGKKPRCSELTYLQGYAEGCRRKSADIQRQAELLEQEGQALEAAIAEF